ncbi:MAG: 30S ribosomal protein S12 methylthiotransferase RimO [bacterium]
MTIEQNRLPAASLTVGFISLGCAKNLVDSQVMAGVLLSENLQLAPSPETADIILINTCAFVADARAEASEAILRACRHKAAGGCRAVIVAGCLPQRYRSRVAKTFPDVDAFVGVDELDRIATIVRQVVAGHRRVMAVGDHAPRRLFTSQQPGLRFSGGPFAYLKVAEGCNHTCAFCAIPGIRGRYRSRGREDLLTEARALLGSGVRELNLISQDTTSYGREQRRAGGASAAGELPALLRELDALEGDFWIRVLYGYPSRVTDEMLDVMASARHVCAYLDLPIQHSHPDILRAMHRADSVRAVAELPQRLRRAVPGIVLRTTCLVGFPGETEAHFQHLLDYVAAAKFDHLGVFAFSPEEGTAAFARADTPAAAVAASRRDRLLRLQRQVVAERRNMLTGTVGEALLSQAVHGRGQKKDRATGVWQARLVRQAPEVDGVTRVHGVPAGAQSGQFLRVRIIGGRGYDLTAEAVCTARPEERRLKRQVRRLET